MAKEPFILNTSNMNYPYIRYQQNYPSSQSLEEMFLFTLLGDGTILLSFNSSQHFFISAISNQTKKLSITSKLGVGFNVGRVICMLRVVHRPLPSE